LAIVLENFLEADFAVVPDNCPLEPIKFTGLSKGKIVAHHWSFGEGGSSDKESPEYTYQQPMREVDFGVQYEVTDSFGCKKSITKPIKIYSSCTVYVPNAFTPNGDGVNDLFRPNQSSNPIAFKLTVFNRLGQRLFESESIYDGWNGNYNGKPVPTGVYYWLCNYTMGDGQVEVQKGHVTLLR